MEIVGKEWKFAEDTMPHCRLARSWFVERGMDDGMVRHGADPPAEGSGNQRQIMTWGPDDKMKEGMACLPK